VFDRVVLNVSDRAASRSFYKTVLAALGHTPTDELEWNDFALAAATAERPATRELHVAFVAQSPEQVDAFWQAGVDAGFESHGAPGLRVVYHDDYYGGFLRDPDGNSAEAVYHGWDRSDDNIIDHLWIRVADLEASRRFYETVAGPLGLDVRRSTRGERIHVDGGDRTFALVPGGEASENVQIALRADGAGAVRGFYAAAISSGFLDAGGIAETGAGVHVASVFDPDGNLIAAVSR
jgi:catechol 2,3-dioxygenase-like lactoylglutathione lyase family enzyme